MRPLVYCILTDLLLSLLLLLYKKQLIPMVQFRELLFHMVTEKLLYLAPGGTVLSETGKIYALVDFTV